MIFEFDLRKSLSNKAKHGIDFEEAQSLWHDEWLLEAPAKTADEPRVLAVGKIDEIHWAAIYTRRGDSIRIISVRRARRTEIERYESE
ncbi:MAG: BrnT family toxin [Parvularculaceae bacterium]